jgi:SPP1 gp7 family putative phage head morphogenesis protein
MTGLGKKLWNGYGGEFFNRIGGGSSASGSSLTQAYRYSPWVQRAINIKASEIAMAPLKFYEGDNCYEEPSFDAFWQSPAVGPDGKRIPLGEVEQQIIGWLDLRGAAYLLLDDSWLLPFPDPKKSAPFIIARPDKMRRIWKGTVLAGYVYTDGAGKSHTLLPEQVVVIKFWNPYEDIYGQDEGLAPLDSAMNAAESDYLAGLYVRNLMRNNGDQGVYVINKDGLPDDKQQEQIVAALRDKRAAALSGDFKPVFLGGNITIEDAKVASPDLAFQTSRIQSRHEIFIALGVPPSMADVIASYSIGSASDRYALISSTCMPLGKKITMPFSLLASKQTGRPLIAELDWDENPVMQEVRRGRIDVALKLWGTGMPMEEINEYLDLGLEEFDGWDVGYLPFSVSPVTTLPADSGTSAPATPSGDQVADGNDIMTESFAAMRKAITQRTAHHAVRPVIRQTPQDIALWKKHEATRRSGEKVTHSAVTKNLMAARAEVLAKIAKLPAGTGKSAAASLLNFNLGEFKKSFSDSMEKAIRFNLKKAAVEFVDEIGGDNPWTLPDHRTTVYLSERENLLAGVPDEIHQSVERQLDEGMAAGESRGDLSNRIRSLFNDMSKGRADTIAQTETGGAYSFARNEGMKDTGVKNKRWLASPDDRTRISHAEADGQTVPIHEPFVVEGEELMYPGDPNGSAENTINCRCVCVAVVGHKAEKVERTQPINIHLPATVVNYTPPPVPEGSVKLDITLHQEAQPAKRVVRVSKPDGSLDHYRTEEIPNPKK